jgi:rhamnulokinase
LALKYRYVNETINRVTGTETEAVHIVGGGSNNAMLNQFTADSVGVPVLAGPKEATAVGNSHGAGDRCGNYFRSESGDAAH